MAEQTQLLAFDRQNHMGASGASAKNLSAAIREEAEAMLSDKRVVSTDVAISENKEKMKVPNCSMHVTALEAILCLRRLLKMQ